MNTLFLKPFIHTLNAYNKMAQRRPLITGAITTGISYNIISKYHPKHSIDGPELYLVSYLKIFINIKSILKKAFIIGLSIFDHPSNEGFRHGYINKSHFIF